MKVYSREKYSKNVSENNNHFQKTLNLGKTDWFYITITARESRELLSFSHILSCLDAHVRLGKTRYPFWFSWEQWVILCRAGSDPFRDAHEDSSRASRRNFRRQGLENRSSLLFLIKDEGISASGAVLPTIVFLLCWSARWKYRTPS